MISTDLLASVPFRNRTAVTDWIGQLDLIHANLAEVISRAQQVEVKKLPLGASRIDSYWLKALTEQHTAERLALGLAPASDFTDFDVNDPGEFASLTFVVASDLEQIRLAAGVV